MRGPPIVTVPPCDGEQARSARRRPAITAGRIADQTGGAVRIRCTAHTFPEKRVAPRLVSGTSAVAVRPALDADRARRAHLPVEARGSGRALDASSGGLLAEADRARAKVGAAIDAAVGGGLAPLRRLAIAVASTAEAAARAGVAERPIAHRAVGARTALDARAARDVAMERGEAALPLGGARAVRTIGRDARRGVGRAARRVGFDRGVRRRRGRRRSRAELDVAVAREVCGRDEDDRCPASRGHGVPRSLCASARA